MSVIINMGLNPEDFITLGIPFYLIVVFIVQMRRFLSSENKKKLKTVTMLSGILAGAALIVSLGYWIYQGIEQGADFLVKVLFSLWLIFGYVIAFFMYNLAFSMPIVEIIWFVVMLIAYSKAEHEHKRGRKIEAFVAGGIAVMHVLIVLILEGILSALG